MDSNGSGGHGIGFPEGNPDGGGHVAVGVQGDPAKPSKVEAIKIASQYLKQVLAQDLDNGESHISEDAATIIKFHGSYQQDDRDVRTQMKREGKEKAYSFMVRIRMPGGKLATAAQYLACAELAEGVGNGTLRITTRQEFQLHGVLKDDLKPTIRAINETSLSTLAACGDVERNVLCCPAPLADPVRAAMQHDAGALGLARRARASSYWDIWLDGEKIENPLLPPPAPPQIPTAGDDAVEPIYGKTYLPRKFKTGVRLARRQLHRYLRERSWIPRDRGRRRFEGVQRPRRRRFGDHAERPEDVSVPGVAAGLRRPRRRPSDRRGRLQSLSRLRQPHRPQARPVEVHHPRLGLARVPGQGRGVSRPPARRCQAGRRRRTSTTTSAGTSKATASSSSACPSRTAASRTPASFACSAA